MKEIMILSINRMGDLLQLTSVMDSLKEQFPQARLTALVEHHFSEICHGMPFIDEYFTLNIAEYGMKINQKQTSLVELYKSLKDLFDKINQKEYDLLINLTFSPYSAYIASLIRAKEVRGISIDALGHKLPKHKWTYHFLNAVINRQINPFNVIDFHLKISQVEQYNKTLLYHVKPEEKDWVDKFLAQKGLTQGEKLIAIQAGASKEHKRWKIEKFADLADRIYNDFGIKVILLGSKSEEKIGKEFLGYAKTPVINAIGETSMAQLAAILGRCSLLISNDTGTMHLATAVGTKALLISLGAANYQETGPYGKDNLIVITNLDCFPCDFAINCPHMVCQEKITVDHVWEAAKLALNKGDLRKNSSFWQEVNLLRTDFDQEGMLDYLPVVPSSKLTKKIFYVIFYRFFWQYSDKKDGFTDLNLRKKLIEDIFKRVHHYYVADHSLNFQAEIEDILKLKLLAHDGIKLCHQLLKAAKKIPQDVDQIKTKGWMIFVLKTKISEIGLIQRNIKPITDMFDFENSHLEGEGLEYLTEETMKLYKGLALQCDIIVESICKTFNLQLKISENISSKKNINQKKIKPTRVEKKRELMAV